MAKKSKMRLNREEKRILQERANSLNLGYIKPKTKNQSLLYKAYQEGKNIFAHGVAGTGKTFISLYLALDDVLHNNNQESVTIIRSTVSSRNAGFLPGKQSEKEAVYKKPYVEICNKLFSKHNAYELLENRKQIKFESTCFLRGNTFENSIVIVDECQNMTADELNTVITRIGVNCRIIFCGDIRQNDLKQHRELTGIADFMRIIREIKKYEFIEFNIDDIVRSEDVKDYIIARTKLEDRGAIKPLYV